MITIVDKKPYQNHPMKTGWFFIVFHRSDHQNTPDHNLNKISYCQAILTVADNFVERNAQKTRYSFLAWAILQLEKFLIALPTLG
jgi:hypothetical protein